MLRATCIALAAVGTLGASVARSTGESSVPEQLRQVMAQEAKKGFWGVVYVSQGDRALLHEGYGLSDRKTRAPMRRDTVIDMGSLSKQVTAAAAVKLASQGKLSLEDPLRKYFSAVPADKAAITLRQLLSHNSGLREWIHPDDFTPIPREAWLEKVFSTPLAKPQGSGYLYSNDGITLVAMVIEQVSGKPFQAYVRETFFKPLGMTRTGWYDDAIFEDPSVSVATGYFNGKDDGAPNEWPGPHWALLGNGGILWNVADMLKWHEAVHGDLLPREARDQLFQPLVTDPERFLNPGETAQMYYGLAWRIGTSECGDRRIGHTGTGITHNVTYRYYRDRDILIYVASNKLDKDYRGVETVYSRGTAHALSRVFMEDCSLFKGQSRSVR